MILVWDWPANVAEALKLLEDIQVIKKNFRPMGTK